MSKPFSTLSTSIVTMVLAATGVTAMAEGPTNSPNTPANTAGMDKADRPHIRDRHDPAKTQARIAEHQAALKVRLKITPAQEPAWSRFTAAMQPLANAAHAQFSADERAAFDKLTTPEQIDKMRTMRSRRLAEMNAGMDQRGDATKGLYAALTPEQQKVFDTEHRKIGWHHDRPGNRG